MRFDQTGRKTDVRAGENDTGPLGCANSPIAPSLAVEPLETASGAT